MSMELAPIARTLFSATAVGDGVWQDAGQWRAPYSVLFTGTFGTDSLLLCVSNDDTKPADNTHGFPYAAAVTASGKIAVTETYKWVKVRKTAGTAAIQAQAFAQFMPG